MRTGHGGATFHWLFSDTGSDAGGVFQAHQWQEHHTTAIQAGEAVWSGERQAGRQAHTLSDCGCGGRASGTPRIACRSSLVLTATDLLATCTCFPFPHPPVCCFLFVFSQCTVTTIAATWRPRLLPSMLLMTQRPRARPMRSHTVKARGVQCLRCSCTVCWRDLSSQRYGSSTSAGLPISCRG